MDDELAFDIMEEYVLKDTTGCVIEAWKHLKKAKVLQQPKVLFERTCVNRNVHEQAKTDYAKAVELELTNLKRWEEGIDHHPMSERLVRFLAEHDFNDYDDYFCWKVGGDGDNGEALMYEMDAFFEMLDH